MSKKLNEEAMQSELAGSAFFAPPPNSEPAVVPDRPTAVQTTNPETRRPAKPETTTPRHRGPATPPPDSEVIEKIRRAVHQLGKEDATYRFTEAEKKALADVVYTYGASGVRTSQNEVTRIAINWLMEDYHTHGAGSVLARVLERLNA